MPPAKYHAFAVTAPGLAPLAADELRALHIVPTGVEPGGVAFEATREKLWAANLWLRTASRVVVRTAEFRATAFHELERFARGIAWARWVDASRPVRLRVTCRKSRLYHSDAVAERVAGAIERAVAGVRWETAGGDEDGDAPEDAPADAPADAPEDAPAGAERDDRAQLFTVRFVRDVCTISADSSGALLHRRGYREALARAPLRETLAAATLRAARWDPAAALVDPMCGSGTLAIEGALLARRIAPGRRRRFAFMDWDDFDAGGWQALLDRADADVLPAAPAPIRASDRDAGAVRATTENAERAGVAADIAIERLPLSAVEAPSAWRGAGWLVSNPPYGKRVGESDALGTLYARLGDVLRERFPGWHAALLSADPLLERRVGVRWEELLRTSNGGIPVRVVGARVPG